MNITSLHDDIVAASQAVRDHNPLVQCITNTVVQQFTANVLLAIGASPAMVDLPGEAGPFAEVADGLLINPGTPSSEQFLGMREAATRAAATGTPFVVDPVAVGGLKLRTAVVSDILVEGPTAVRGNASEIGVITQATTGGRGVDSQNAVADVLASAKEYVAETSQPLTISGPSDAIVHPEGAVWVDGGHELLTKVIGTGCSLGAMCAAYLGAATHAGVGELPALVGAHAHLKAAGTVAAQKAQAPGSFAVVLLDALYELKPEEIVSTVTIREA
ncbi:hydroxyethylthiazole kinase [Corynebacterium renale]|uniref:hydroxyethylthiazole kinase n=1 Tax=Corynebacterium renale TaxID=1724 RepID=UPI000DA35E52|nr:hydroxyethylthiazole kinase [Corynebacterium renale]SQG65146.1 hydroxyethylthiazole kinase [Corynebacterium renale]STC98058.1 hydroxyethylthiazole kinase [Corynebacterium renale]